MKLDVKLNIEKGEFLYRKSNYCFRYNSRETAYIKLLEMLNGGYVYEIEVAFDVPETYKKFTDFPNEKAHYSAIVPTLGVG